MGKILAGASILLVIVLIVILFPKISYNETDTTLEACNCIGLAHENKCFGLTFECSVIGKSKLVKHDREGVDLTLLLDKSKSMQGTPLIEAKKAAFRLVDSLGKGDRLSIISFDKYAKVLQGFSTDKDALKKAIENINASEETYYLPALKQALENYKHNSRSKDRKVIFISDGEPTDSEDVPKIYDSVYSLTGDEMCLYTIGYGTGSSNDKKTEEVLENMAQISTERAKCGGFYKSTQNLDTLTEIFDNIYQDTKDTKLKISFLEPTQLVYNSTSVPLNISTNTDSVCSYRLNNGNTNVIFRNNIMLFAKPGKNNLEVTCKKIHGTEQVVTESRSFYVKNNPLKDLFTRPKEPRQEIDKLTDDEVEFLLKEIISKQEIKITRRLSPKGGGTVVYIIIENTKPVKLHNIRLSQTIPNTIISSINEFSSNYLYQIDRVSPVEVSFDIDEMEPDGVVIINYYLERYISSAELAKISTKITFDEVSEDNIKDIIAIQNRTRDIFDIKQERTQTADGTDGRILFSPKRETENIRIYLNIPKCMAYNLNKVYFRNQNYRVVSEDPLVLWQLQDAGSDFEIDYHIDKALEEECAKKISVLTIGKPLLDENTTDRTNMLLFIFPTIIFCLIVLYIVSRKVKNSKISRSKKKIFRLLIVSILIGSTLFFMYPKTRYENENFCQCFGASLKETCFGANYDCHIPRSVVSVEKKTPNRCNANCENIRQYMNVDPFTHTTQGMDLMLMLDRSRSMADEEMDQAKAALINLIPKDEPENRIALIQFDNTAQLVQKFTNDRQTMVDAINSINIGMSTKYIPALTTAHYTFLKNGKLKNQWQVIFVSDGAPGDLGKPESIYEKVREMAKDEICINTVGFGSDVPGGEAETILKEMARISKEYTGCGVYYYSQKEISMLSKVLNKMYEEAQVKRIGLDIDLNVNSLFLTEKEPWMLDAKIFSQINGQPIPGKFPIGRKHLCSPEADIDITLSSKDQKNTTINLTGFSYNQILSRYKLETSDLPPGKYEANMFASVKSRETSCDISDSVYIGDLEVAKKSRHRCTTDECYNINRYLFSDKLENYVYIYITDYAFVPQHVPIKGKATVIWKNIGKKPHTVTSGINEYDGTFNSGLLFPGDTFNYTFTDNKSRNFFDNMSKTMRGLMNQNRSKNYTIGNFSLEYKKNIDLSLLIDKSGSMSGQKISNVKSAAKNLARIIYPGDRVSVIRFDEDANIVNTFTSDKSIITNSIDELKAGGQTLYIPALEKARENYDIYGYNDTGKIVIFLSDGAPWDSGGRYRIYNEVTRLIDDGICIYTIGYGPEVFPGSKSEAILQHIVDLSQESTYCGHYKYSPSDKIRLTKIFGSIYHEAIGQMDGLSLDLNVPKKYFYDNESILLAARVSSSFNDNPLPGEYNLTGEMLCVPPAKVTARIINSHGKIVKKIELKYVGKATGYTANLHDLRPGDYLVEVVADSVVATGSSCNYIGKDTFEITVLNSDNITFDPLFLVFLFMIIIFLIILFRESRK